MNPTVIGYALQLLTQVVPLIAQSVNAKAAYEHGTAKLQQMVAENRDPTPAEWDEANAKTEELRKLLHAA
jgi:hypothetical protein